MKSVDWADRAEEACALAAALPSPCNGVCQMEEPVPGQTKVCRGCWRTLAEIGAWANFSDDEKRRVWRQLPHRAQSALEEGGA